MTQRHQSPRTKSCLCYLALDCFLFLMTKSEGDRVRQQRIKTHISFVPHLNYWCTKHQPGIEPQIRSVLGLTYCCLFFNQQGLLRAYSLPDPCGPREPVTRCDADKAMMGSSKAPVMHQNPLRCFALHLLTCWKFCYRFENISAI